jgi:hypothetical protein
MLLESDKGIYLRASIDLVAGNFATALTTARGAASAPTPACTARAVGEHRDGGVWTSLLRKLDTHSILGRKKVLKARGERTASNGLMPRSARGSRHPDAERSRAETLRLTNQWRSSCGVGRPRRPKRRSGDLG